MIICSLFSGIGGIEYGLHKAGHDIALFCETDGAAKAVLRDKFPGVRISSDVASLKALPSCDVVTAGFPCQDLSQVGTKRGINGKNSKLVRHLFRLLELKSFKKRPEWLVIENVPNMLRLNKGRAMRYIIHELESLGYTWAYRIVDARAFQLPQRRPRVILLATKSCNPAKVLFSQDSNVTISKVFMSKPNEVDSNSLYGFYWTEGLRGVGWAQNSTPPIKGGSGLGIPSPPAIWVPKKDFVGTPDIRDAERLQGFPENWTLAATNKGYSVGARWKLVGNAVCTPVSLWIEKNLTKDSEFLAASSLLDSKSCFPDAAWGQRGKVYKVEVSRFPFSPEGCNLKSFLKFPLKPLSLKATNGFISRTQSENCNISYSDIFIESLKRHAQNQMRLLV